MRQGFSNGLGCRALGFQGVVSGFRAEGAKTVTTPPGVKVQYDIARIPTY